ncbi:MAG: 50S ribosomal protein L21 [Moorea sp. SIO3C2]|nr:50S ribosomal protein L21 [Moorena sp. SIO3C2]
MTYAIIETGGKQLRVEPGRFYDIELLHVEPEQNVTIDKVLFVNHDGEISIGQPLVEGATVQGTVMRHFRDRKIIVYKMQPKKKTRKKRGHRQEKTRLMIDAITKNGFVLASVSKAEEAPVSAETAPEAAATEAPATQETAETAPE